MYCNATILEAGQTTVEAGQTEIKNGRKFVRIHKQQMGSVSGHLLAKLYGQLINRTGWASDPRKPSTKCQALNVQTRRANIGGIQKVV